MTGVPCSVPGCGADGTRWVHEQVRVERYGVILLPKTIDIPRFVCDEHAKEFAVEGWAVTPPLPVKELTTEGWSTAPPL